MDFQSQRLVKKESSPSPKKEARDRASTSCKTLISFIIKTAPNSLEKGAKFPFIVSTFRPANHWAVTIAKEYMAIYHNKGYDRTVSVRKTTLTNLAVDRRNTQNFNQNLLLCSSTYICIFQNPYCQNPFNQEYVTPGLRVVKLYILQLKLVRRSRKSEKKTRILSKPENKPQYSCMTH